mmetsp:Transcript_81340/g.226499  ORF Transcript_81340/g.226499 Transcript_81340/m.226499 type:complete len:518 (-) Transcript_81340:138-1691(-)
MAAQEIGSEGDGGVSEEDLKAAFMKFDSDNSGSINISELQNAMKILGVKCNQNSAKKVLDIMDKDGNGTIELDEFINFFCKISNADEMKFLLSDANRRFFEYKQTVETDPTFAKTFTIPPSIRHHRMINGHEGEVEAVKWISDTQLLSGSIDGEIKLWDVTATERYPRPLRSISLNGVPLYSMAATPNGESVLVGLSSKKDNIKLLSMQTGDVLSRYGGHETPVYSCCFDADGAMFLSGSKNGQMCIHDTGYPEPKCRWKGHLSVVYSMAFDASQQRICSASADGTVKVFDDRSFDGDAKAALVIDDAAASGRVFKALWRKEHEIISGGEDYCMKRWDIRKVRDGPISSYFGHTSEVRAIELSPDGEFLVSGTQSGAIRVWLSDEAGRIRQQREQAMASIQELEAKKNRDEEGMLNGEVLPEDLKATCADLSRETAVHGKLIQVQNEQLLLGCTQARLGLDGSSLPVSSIAWRNLASERDVACIACGSHDQSVRIFKVELATLRDFLGSEPFKSNAS